MANETVRKFGYPETTLQEYDHWVVLLRPEQVTAGCVVLACKEDAESLPEVSPAAYVELQRVTADLESAIRTTFSFDKINYLLLMMVDKQVHWHVIPRYGDDREFAGARFQDSGWPRHPNMTDVATLSDNQFRKLQDQLKADWPSG